MSLAGKTKSTSPLEGEINTRRQKESITYSENDYSEEGTRVTGVELSINPSPFMKTVGRYQWNEISSKPSKNKC